MKIKKKKYESGKLKNIENGKGIFGRDSICISWGFFSSLPAGRWGNGCLIKVFASLVVF
jgi:hypothetical protein